jgi:hypothetical protein
MLFQLLDRLSGWENEQCDLAASGFTLHIVHHGQATCSGADDQTTTSPRDLLFDRNRRVPELVAEFLRWLLLPHADVPAVDHDVVLVGHAVEAIFPRPIATALPPDSKQNF